MIPCHAQKTACAIERGRTLLARGDAEAAAAVLEAVVARTENVARALDGLIDRHSL